jgi:hypothetical protein
VSDRLPPFNEEAEVSVLGSVLLSQHALDLLVLDVRLRPADFYRDRHGRIFEAMLRLSERPGAAVDAVTVSDELERVGELDVAGGRPYVHSLPNQVPSAGNVRYYAEIVRDHSAMRQLLDVGRRLRRGAHRGVAAGRPWRITSGRCSRSCTATGRALTLEQRQHDLVDHVERGDTGIVGSWPFADLNEMTGGVWPGPPDGAGRHHPPRQERPRGPGPAAPGEERGAAGRDLPERDDAEGTRPEVHREQGGHPADAPDAREAPAGRAREVREGRAAAAVRDRAVLRLTAGEIVRDIRRRGWRVIVLDLMNKLPGSSKVEDIDENVRTLSRGRRRRAATSSRAST